MRSSSVFKSEWVIFLAPSSFQAGNTMMERPVRQNKCCHIAAAFVGTLRVRCQQSCCPVPAASKLAAVLRPKQFTDTIMVWYFTGRRQCRLLVAVITSCPTRELVCHDAVKRLKAASARRTDSDRSGNKALAIDKPNPRQYARQADNRSAHFRPRGLTASARRASAGVAAWGLFR